MHAPTSTPHRRPLLGLLAALLVSGQFASVQAATPPPTWQSSPVLTKFMTDLRMPGEIPVALPDGTRTFAGSRLVASHYTIDINEFYDQLHPGMPPTTLWGYNPTRALGVAVGTTPIQKHLGGIIIAQMGVPIQVTFRNNLPNKHILPVDTSIQGAEPGIAENRTATHLHGGLVPWISDGGPFSFWDPQGGKGVTFQSNGVLRPLETVPANEAEYYYPNNQTARMMWYHDHAMGITRLNAYAGIASAYIIRDKYEASLVKDFGLPKFVENGGRELPLVFQDKIFQNGNKPTDPDRPFPGSAVGEGNLWYPYEYDPTLWNDTTALGVSVVPEAFGDTMLVNGAAYPKASVDPRRYRLRILNACNARVLNLALYEEDALNLGQPDFTKPGPAWTVIGTEGGFLAKPVVVPQAKLTTLVDSAGGRYVDPAAPGGSLIVAPGERLDVVMNLNGKGGKSYILYNDAPGPYPNGGPENDYPSPTLIGDTSVLMRFEVKADAKTIAKDTPWMLTPKTPLAADGNSLIDPPLAGPSATAAANKLSWASITTKPLPIPTRKGVTVRQLTLNEAFDANNRLIQMLGTNIKTPAGDFGRPYYDPKDPAGSIPTEVSTNNATEVWQIANLTGDTHPIHFHLSNVQILSRQGFDAVTYGTTTAVGAAATPTTMGPARGPEATEIGWKETVKMHPGEITTVIMKLALPAVPFVVPVSPRTGGNEYVWHCHILEHEEHDMMRTLVVK
ncbi:MAG: multicopper oxidase domain-containing protein [Acidobacteria bacterium]|nr:multicopper oxidase domain-containing protein [Acidobacteriota bacterium]